MATRSYTIPDLDDDNEIEAPNLFSKRQKTENSSTINETTSSLSIPSNNINDPEPSDNPQPSVSIPSNTINDTEPLNNPQPSVSIPSSSSLLVHSRQRGNPLLKHLRQVKWEYSDMILGGADYSMSRSSCALFLSLRYHTLNPNYIYDRLKTNKLPYQLKILLIQCDTNDPSQSLKELARLCILYDLTLLVSWTDEESARYLETYRIMEGKSAENLMDTQQHQSTDYLTKFIDTITQVKSINKTDAQTLLHAFGSLKSILNATNEQLCVCPGLGSLKAQRLHQSFNQPFKRQKQKQKTNKQEKHFQDERLDLSNIDEDL
jgi:DNA excision repair protein ERCC-1